jgi:hypothetical protein
MAVRAKWSADYTKGLGVRLNGAKSLETGRDVVPAQRSLVERRLHVGMHLEHDRELVRQGNDRRAPGLASKALSSKSFAVPAETVHPLPWRVTDYARPLLRVKYRLCLSTLFARREDNWGKIIAAINTR